MNALSERPAASPFTAIDVAYSFAPVANMLLKPSPQPGLEMRDLHLSAASGRQMGGIEYRAAAAGDLGQWVLPQGATYVFLFLLAGTIRFKMPDGAEVTLEKFDAVHLPFLRAVRRARYSADFVAVEVSAPAHDGLPALEPVLQIPETSLAGDWEKGVSRERGASYVAGTGPRRFMRYRDLGSMALTGNRIHMHVVKAVEAMEGGTGWHEHSMSQIFMVIGGAAVIGVEGGGESKIVTGDAMTIGHGLRHNVNWFTEDYLVLEMCLPGHYDTTPRSAP